MKKNLKRKSLLHEISIYLFHSKIKNLFVPDDLKRVEWTLQFFDEVLKTVAFITGEKNPETQNFVTRF